MMTSRLKVRDLMSENVLRIGPEDDLATLYGMMREENVRHVPVVDEEGDLVGLVSHRDLLRGALAFAEELPMLNREDLLSRMFVQEVMISDVETADPEQPISEAAAMMLENKFGCLPVVEGSRLVGILTESDFVRFLAEG
ncbi:MAG: CBS domain-containing protein [Acidobacteriota bacterium]|nr:MAG: CBS domain-containing protein [Acidobacteriota bacterium]